MTSLTQALPHLQNTSANEPIVFEDGLVGCHEWKRFMLMVADGEDELPIAVLQSLDDLEVSLLVTDPTFLDPSYSPRLTAEDRHELGLDHGMQPTLFCTLSTAHDGWITANLLGPLVVNPHTRRAKQVVLTETTYSTRHPVARLVAATTSDPC
jgi:flagellar assembly factor FliW